MARPATEEGLALMRQWQQRSQRMADGASDAYRELLTRFDPKEWRALENGDYDRLTGCLDCGGGGCRWCEGRGYVRVTVTASYLREREIAP